LGLYPASTAFAVNSVERSVLIDQVDNSALKQGSGVLPLRYLLIRYYGCQLPLNVLSLLSSTDCGCYFPQNVQRTLTAVGSSGALKTGLVSLELVVFSCISCFFFGEGIEPARRSRTWY